MRRHWSRSFPACTHTRPAQDYEPDGSEKAESTQPILLAHPANIIVDEAIHATFTADTSNHIKLHSEFLDVARFPGEEQRQRQWDFFRQKYRERPPDLVIAVGGGALACMADRAELFGGAPIVYCSVAGDRQVVGIVARKILVPVRRR
jgi:Asp/Glu/hydantoin racemase